ncbi:MAG: hypothetical protein DRQ14_02245 [Candidatus Latescibacterota bacterium]|nr:MAG: hypothetical protein DRQ14_02245 [Candidatus Latescibacterota bacterium]
MVHRLRLRPYHPPYILAYLGSKADMRPAMRYAVEKVREGGPGLEVELVEGFDDICMRCEKLEKRPSGSVWGEGYSCPTAEDPDMVRSIADENEAILKAIGLKFGDVLRARELFPLFADKLPELKSYPQCGKDFIQENYLKGMELLLRLWDREEGRWP